jgi:hypothetical protein
MLKFVYIEVKRVGT